MEDKANIVNFLASNFYVRENYALDKQNIQLRNKIKRLESENRVLTRRITNRNHRIGILEERHQFNEQYYSRQMNLQRIFVNIDNNCHTFRRNEDGIFVQVEEDPDETESETELEFISDERAQDVARRLGFETDSDGYISDDLMRSLLGDE